jgi:hypothetical protein
MKAHYFRSWDGEYFLVPEEHEKGFDELTAKLDSERDQDKKEDLYEEFNDKYYEYKQEGDLYTTKLFIES